MTNPETQDRRAAWGEAVAWLSLILIAIPPMVAAMYFAAILYMDGFGLDWHARPTWWEATGLVAAMILAIPVGLEIGGWLWALVARFLFRLTRTTLEKVVFYGPQIPVLVRYNTWCLDLLYGPKKIWEK